ncbi:MAG: N-acetylmuramoyl-L-alanine amidase [candidate division KSB1 bacterium]|nr:N-acetylmuramoyl-L-alanine amidase [candidate division KSB1 bacterium]MDZ7274743.1 N-acetylmuramoyl-L-alanine amidase [candidate division KSB1 bacterium]MDZ7285568.1 N-acetylmuramoyl-L-alanine amidase [candidate division KSB1 bacterium]MDZ7298600.1 N-acetylmuramoyl-L-alanine amidase [candidate division KSB1 bacterium]MDZ7306779.1 N-acetylmuramoyl-L-alanine amidase [candidate division KSB1 bacterium]
MIIALDPGHGGIFTGAIGTAPYELREKDVTLAICLKLKDLLKAAGHKVILTRSSDVHLAESIAEDLRRRAEIANRAAADLLVSVHCNAFSDPNPEGMETWHRLHSPASEKLARAIQAALMAKFSNHLNRGVKARDLLLFRHANMPACHVETEFLTNPAQLEFLASEFNQAAIAGAIAEGVLQVAKAAPARR